MGKLKRRIRRNAEKEAKKELAAKVGLFDKLGDKCLVCEKEFDKKDKEMVTSWSVVVRKDPGTVNLYCPECWQRAKALIEEIKEDMNERTKEQD